jgi:hypothetical protein
MSKRITKTEFYSKGGFANSRLYRKQRADGAWAYYELLD